LFSGVSFLSVHFLFFFRSGSLARVLSLVSPAWLFAPLPRVSFFLLFFPFYFSALPGCLAACLSWCVRALALQKKKKSLGQKQGE